MYRFNRLYVIMLLVLIPILMLNAQQQEKPRPSPNAQVHQMVGDVDVTVTYCRPGIKGRTIWGELVPFGELWRTGANEATTIEFSGEVKLNGNEVPAGKYALFTIPEKDMWTVILNKVPAQSGTAQYDQEQDLLRFKVTPLATDQSVERLLFGFEYQDKNKSKLFLGWEKLKIYMDIEAYKADITNKKIRVSPTSTVKQTIGLTEITVNYCAPGVKGRTIWGDLVPYGKVWRTGANEASIISFGKDVKINGNTVAAGEYSLFTIPGEEEWTIILNKTAKQWGAFQYDEGQDLLRFKVKPVTSDTHQYERLVFHFEDLEDYSGSLVVSWEKISVPIKIETS